MSLSQAGAGDCYIITAVNSFGESLASAEVSTTPVFPAGDPLPPASVSVTFNGTQNTITWPSVANATTYNIYWSTRPIFPDKTAADNVIRGSSGNPVMSPFTHTGLTNGQVYCYIVTALDSNGESANSTQVCGPGGTGGIQIIWP